MTNVEKSETIFILISTHVNLLLTSIFKNLIQRSKCYFCTSTVCIFCILCIYVYTRTYIYTYFIYFVTFLSNHHYHHHHHNRIESIHSLNLIPFIFLWHTTVNVWHSCLDLYIHTYVCVYISVSLYSYFYTYNCNVLRAAVLKHYCHLF